MKAHLSLLLASLCLVQICGAEPPKLPTDPDDRPTLQSIYAQSHDLLEFIEKSDQGIVLVFMGAYCPVAQQYIPTLTKLYEEYRERGIPFIAVYPNRGLELAKMAKHAHDANLPFPAFLDVDHRLADIVQAKMTPEMVSLVSHMQGVLTTYDTSGHRNLRDKAAGGPNTSGES